MQRQTAVNNNGEKKEPFDFALGCSSWLKGANDDGGRQERYFDVDGVVGSQSVGVLRHAMRAKNVAIG